MKKIPGTYILDIYIIKKFLGTFFFAITMILLVTVIFDLSEKLDEFMENKAPVKNVIMDYFLNFLPYFAAQIAPMFTFIAVIFFTSRMAYNTEVIAILSNGVSFNRLLVPYFIGATIIVALNIFMNARMIPHANQERFAFEEKYYYNSPHGFRDRNIHKQLEPGIYIYMESYSTMNNMGHNFSIEKFVDNKLVSKLLAKEVRWDTGVKKWVITNYMIREYLPDGTQKITSGSSHDSTLKMNPEDFNRRENAIEAMDNKELNRFIDNQVLQGASNISALLVEKYQRVAVPFSTFILTLIGVAVSSRKVRGGIGMHIAIGMGVSTSYLLFLKFSTQFAIGGSLPPFFAVWSPNALYTIIALFLYKFAPK
jgi:lipopolysaccharide export system permease protein